MEKKIWNTPEVIELSVKNTESGPAVTELEDPNYAFYGPLGS
jgi:hypothetical protein